MTLSIILYAYIAIIILFLIFAMISILHMIFLTEISTFGYIMTSVFIVALSIIIFGSWFLLQDIDWDAPLLGTQQQSEYSSPLFQ